MNVISLEQISRTFGLGNGTTAALNDISLEVPKGEFLVIMGPSGSGKSTLLNIIGLLDQPEDVQTHGWQAHDYFAEPRRRHHVRPDAHY